MYCFDFSALVVTGYLPSYLAKNLRLPMKKKKEVKKKHIWLKIREVKILNQHFFHGATSVKLSAQNFLWIMTIQSLHKQNRTLHITSKASFVLVEYSIYVKHKKKHTEYKKL